MRGKIVFRREQPSSTGGTFTRVPDSFAGAAFYLVLPGVWRFTGGICRPAGANTIFWMGDYKYVAPSGAKSRSEN